MKRIVKMLIDSGIVLVPIIFICILVFCHQQIPHLEYNMKTYLMMAGGSLVVWLLLISSKGSDTRKQNDSTLSGKSSALRPPVPTDMLYKTPVGFCFGKYRGRYVCKKVEEPGSILITGGSGSGKSSTLIQSFLLTMKDCTALVLDLKHELADKCLKPQDILSPDNPDGTAILLDPLDRENGYGYDPFFMLTEDSTDEEIHAVMEIIAQCIIPIPKGDSAVWNQAAQQFLRGAMTYFYEEGVDTLPGIIREIKSSPIKDIVGKIVSSALPGSCSYTDIVGFQDMADETIMSVGMNLDLKIVQFITNPDLEWCLGENPNKCSPMDMLEKSIYLCLPEDKLQQWGQLVFLVVNQFLYWMMSLPEHESEPDRKRFAMILDETVALLAGVGAPMPLLSQCLRIGARGKGCTMVVCVQSIAGLYEVQGKDQTRDMVSNMSYKYILDSSDSETSKEIIGWAGRYLKRKVSSSGSGTGQKNSISFEEDSILREQDLMSLPQTGDAILISNRAGYLR